MVLKTFYLVYMFRLQKISRNLMFVIMSFSILSTCEMSYANEANEVTENLDVDETYSRAQDASTKAALKLNEIVRGTGGIEKFEDVILGKSNVKHRAEELGNLPQKGEKLKEKTYAELPDTGCTVGECNIANVMSSSKAMHERESKLEVFGFKKDKDQFLESNNGVIDKANYNAKKISEKFDGIKGSYKNCKPGKNVNSYKQEIECDEYYDVMYKNCLIAQIVEIDPKYTYQCTRKREESIKTCYDEITSVKCKESAECDNNGIILSSVRTNLQSQSYNYPTLYVGTPHWRPWVCQVDSSKYTTFMVKNLVKVKSFILERVQFDDYVMIKLNDHMVYHGPDSEAGEDRIELVIPGKESGHITTNGYNKKICERNSNWNMYLLKELKQYLKEGENIISITIATSGAGRAEMWIKTTQHCCKYWDIKRETRCEYEVGK